MTSHKIPRIAVLVDTATGWGRRLIRGVAAYEHEHGPWDLWIRPRGQQEHQRLLPGWSGDGIIARISDHATARHIATARVPVVNVSGIKLGGVNYCRVTTSLRSTGQLAASHLLDCGLQHFVYASLSRLSYVRHQYQGFVDKLEQAGHQCPHYQPSFQPNSRKGLAAQERELGQWLLSLPKPVGIFAWGTALGLQLIECCRHIGLNVPEDVAILGGDYDELLCESCTPSLSGVAVPSEQVGYEAAHQLDRLMQGEPAPAKSIRLEPHGVSARQSTNLLAIDDDDLAKAIRFIRDRAAEPIDVNDVLREVAISRRGLERGFQKVLGRSPSAEIRRQHLELAKRLLRETDLPTPDVAKASGFNSATYFATVFHNEVGQTPLQYRSTTRAR